jgi:hypothetical protein
MVMLLVLLFIKKAMLQPLINLDYSRLLLEMELFYQACFQTSTGVQAINICKWKLTLLAVAIIPIWVHKNY